MSAFEVGVFIDSFRRGPIKGLETAAALEADSFQVYVTKNEMLAENMDATARREFVKRYRDSGLRLSATCGDFGINYSNQEKAPRGVELLKAAVDQAVDLETNIITTHIGKLPDEDVERHEEVLIRNLNEIGKYAESKGIFFASETGLESGERLAGILGRLDTNAVRINFDPANLVMRQFDHIQCLRDLAKYVVHTHAKDGKRGGKECPLGQGDVDFPKYLGVLINELGFNGALTIERECGDDPVKDVSEAVAYLKQLRTELG